MFIFLKADVWGCLKQGFLVISLTVSKSYQGLYCVVIMLNKYDFSDMFSSKPTLFQQEIQSVFIILLVMFPIIFQSYHTSKHDIRMNSKVSI